MGNHIGDRAVVLGGSIAGMLAALPLSEAYREVILIDRDDLDEPEPNRPAGVLPVRRAVPHGWQLQALLAKGQQVLEGLFPGMTDELVSFGASKGDFNKNVRWYFDGRKIKQVTDPTGTYGFAYDNKGRLVGTTTQYSFVTGTYSNAYTYDAASNRTSLTAPDGSITTYGYDTLNRLKSAKKVQRLHAVEADASL